MLLGRAAGLQATVSSPQPGGGINISIRGAGQRRVNNSDNDSGVMSTGK